MPQYFTDIHIEYVLNAGDENSDIMMDIKPGHGEGRRCWVDMDQRVQEHPEWGLNRIWFGHMDIGISQDMAVDTEFTRI